MQPYVNPNYFNQYQPYQQQYQPQYQRFQMQEPKQPCLCGALVDDFGIITANDVPMDGSPAVFVKKDGKEIELRQWGSDGQIRRTVYMPKLDDLSEKVENPTPEYIKALNDRFNAFEQTFAERFDKIEKNLKTSRRKEVSENE